MRRFRKILLRGMLAGLLVVLTAALVVNSRAFQEYVKEQIVRRLETATGGKVSIDSFDLGFFPLRVNLAGLTIQHPDWRSAPFLTIRQAEAHLYWRSLTGALRMKLLTVDGPVFHAIVRADGTSNIPRPRQTSANTELWAVVADRLDLQHGRVQYNDQSHELTALVENLGLAAYFEEASARYRALLKYDSGSIRVGKFSWDYALDLELGIERDQLRVARLLASTQRSKLEAHGTLRSFSDPVAELAYSGLIDLSDVRPLAARFRQLAGGVRVSGSLSGPIRQWQASGILEGGKLFFNGTRVERMSSQYSFEPSRLRFEKIQVAGLHGRVEGRFSLQAPFGKRRYAVDLQLKEVGLPDLAVLAGVQRAQFSGKVAGTLKASWLDNWKGLTGDGRLSLSESAAESTEHRLTGAILPVSGELNFAISELSSEFRNSFLKLGRSRLQFSGNLAANKASNVRFEARSEALSDLEFLVPGLNGKASLVGTLEGTRLQPRIGGSFLAEQLSYQKWSVDQAQGRFEGDQRVLDLLQVELTQGATRVHGRGKVFLDPARLVPTGDVHLLADFQNARSEDLYAMLGESYPASGSIHGKLMAVGHLPNLALEGHLQSRQGQFFGQPYSQAEADFRYQDSVLELKNVAAAQWGGEVRGDATVDLKQAQLRAKIQAAGILLDQVPWMQTSGNPIGGRVRTLDISADGPYQFPSLNGEFELADLTVAGERVGDFRAHLSTENRLLRVQAESLTPETDLRASGSIRLDENLDCIAQLAFRNFVLSPYVRRMLPAAPEKLSSRAEGQLVLSGPLRHAERLIITGRLQSMEINFREAQLRAARPFEIDVRSEQVNIKDASFVGKGTRLGLSGLVDLSRQRRLQLALRGDIDLALLNEFVKKLSASGAATVNASVRGTLAEPRIQGQARVSKGQFAYTGLPNAFSDVNGSFFFDENQVKVENLNGSSGGGKVQVNGDVVFGQEQVRLMNLRIQGREVRIRYPEGMRNVVDADLTLRGSQRAQVLAGNIHILSASFQKGYDPISQFLQERSTRPTWQGTQELGGSLSLDLAITGDRNIKLDTQLIKMTSRADLRVKGTAANPLVTGSIEASGGELYFQGARYRITRGRLDLLNPVRIDPRIDLEAETDLRDYRIVLNINGTADKFRADLRSDPPLPTVDLFSLVSSGGTGGAGLTPSSYRPYATSGRQQENSAAAASALLSEGLSMKVGSGVKRLFGLDRFRVDPFLVGNERDPSARLTFGQQITKDFSITYSTSVSSNEQQIILLEYQLNDSTSIIASRDAEGSFGLDVRFRKRLRQKNR